MNDINYLKRVEKLNLDTLEARCVITDLITMFKTSNNLIDIDCDDSFQSE